MTAELITDARALADVCRELRRAEWLVLDTEFLRERTYRARLCLVQLATDELLAVIDPLAIEDLAPLAEILHDPGVRKVLHAARQDLEVFYDRHQRVPAPLFDTQIGAAYLGFDDQAGYATLVTALTGVTLDKAHTRADWSLRPLSAAQLRYAEDDVRYLRPVFHTLLERLQDRGRLAWAEDDCRRLTDPALYANAPATAWRRLRGGADLTPAGQQVLRALAAWREAVAQHRDLPRGWVLRDDVLLELARRTPRGAQELVAIPGLEDGARRRLGDGLLAAIEAGLQAEPEILWPRSEPLSREQTALAKQLMTRIRDLAAGQQMAPAVLATRRDAERLVRGTSPSEIWDGWRLALLGPALAELLPSPVSAVTAP